MDEPYELMPDIDILPSYFPIPGLGFLAVNAFVIRAGEPVLIDTGMGIESEAFMEALASIIDPPDLRWVWLTHDDLDHTGSLQKVLEAAPNARLVANSLAVVRMSSAWPVPMHRVNWLNSGDSIVVGDRKLTALRPPLFDNPTTIGVYDNKSEVLFSVDCFGAIISSPTRNAEDIGKADLAQGMISWASADCPWVHMVETTAFSQTLDTIRQLSPKMILSAHLPPAQGKTEQLLDLLAAVPASPPAIAPDQIALEQMLGQTKDQH
jgi:flavorubredoxin